MKPASALVIGIGNRLRGDDGVGALLAEQAALWAAVDDPLSVRCVQQLTPELAADLACCEVVLFIDAWLAPLPSGAAARPRLDRLEPEASELGGFHRLPPGQLLAISQMLYGCCPQADLLRVPAHALEHGTALSGPLRAQLPAAQALLHHWLLEVACSSSHA